MATRDQADTVLRAGFAALLLLAYALLLLAFDGLRGPPYKDEVHFLATVHHFATPFPPSLAQLRDYGEVLTPLAFVVWGQLERLTGDPLFAGRALNLALSLAMLLWLALGPGARGRSGMAAALGLLAFPYYTALSVHLYTDVPATALAIVGLWLHRMGRGKPAALFYALAIATRQYTVLVPAAAALWECGRALSGEQRRLRKAFWSGGAAVTLLLWFVFYGGLAPPSGMAEWLPRYRAPMASFWDFELTFGLYYLSALGAYFVLPEWALFSRSLAWRVWLRPRTAVVAGGLLLLFLWAPPLAHEPPNGLFDRAVKLALPPHTADLPRMALYWVLACAAVLRFTRRIDLPFWLFGVQLILSMKSQLAWEKYLLPLLMVLWYLAGRGGLEPETPKRSPGPDHGLERGR